MKKLICALLICVGMFGMVGCSNTTETVEGGRFELLPYTDAFPTEYSSTYIINYYRDVKTNIVYMLNASVRQGGISPLYNANGEPMTYDEFMEDIAK